MGIEKIRKNAPDGAKHYRIRTWGIGVAYYILICDMYFSMDSPSRYSLEHESIKPL